MSTDGQDDSVLAMMVNSFSDVVGEGGPSEVGNVDGIRGNFDNHDSNGERCQTTNVKRCFACLKKNLNAYRPEHSNPAVFLFCFNWRGD